ncbi:hypothetical protein [Sphingomonas sp. 28-62-11]|uniref:hypothetical protein n=1 Tax=Sphingomonas sp. 28-62-11 TaxID=1970432 RepID=UPI000BD71467|nr:MAG: hypothetical protein B7Y49_02375 [Sphingomonas sp. 28-62-11]
MRGSTMLLGLLVPLALSLAGCGGDKEGTTITFNATDNDEDGEGNVAAGVDGKSGEVSIKAPGFSGKFTLPKLTLGGGDIDLNGVKLYPGSTVTTMNINAKAGKEGEKDNDSVRIVFDSPATPEKVLDYYAENLGKAEFTLTRKGDTLTGTDDEKKPFSLEVKPAANGHSTGTIKAGG